jgi:hypothetical protein
VIVRKNSRKITVWVLACTAVGISLLGSAPVSAQVAGATLSGTVTDTSGAVIPNAKLSIANTATRVTRSVTTDTAGFYSVPNLLPGTYDVSTSAPGFSTQVQTGIALTVGAQQLLNVSLQVGQVTQKVQVTGAAPAVQLANSTLSDEINSTTIRELPLNGRDWTQLANFEPGIVAVRTQIATANGGTSSRGTKGYGNQVSDAGHRPTENNYRVNGISVVDFANGSPGSVTGAALGVDAIQEFSVLTSNYDAEYGRTSGGVFNAITKSGANAFHGDAYWFLRDRALDARNFFDPAIIPPFHRNQFGASGGGPLKKDKTFFFVDYEGLRQDKTISFSDNVPSPAARSGQIHVGSTLCTIGIVSPGCTLMNSAGTVGVDPKVVPFLAFYPLPNAGLVGSGDVGVFRTGGLVHVSENYVTARGDHKISDKDSLAASWSRDNAPLTQPDALDDVLSEQLAYRQMFGLEETHIFSPTLVNTVRGGYNRTMGLQFVPVSAINPLAADLTLSAIPGRPAPVLQVPGLTQMAGSLGAAPQNTITMNSFQFYDDAFLTRGTHSLKFGFAAERMQYNSIFFRRQNGFFSFPSLAGFLENTPSSAQLGDQAISEELGARQTLFGAYLQDDWRLRSNLTLNLGVRYEPTTLPTEAHNRYQVVQDFFGGVPVPVKTLWQTNQTLANVAPRVGFSWDPFRNGKTAVRGGFGIFDVLPIDYLYAGQVGTSFPFTFTASVGNLPPGSFPTGALALIGFNEKAAQVRYIEQHPHRNYAMNWNLNIQREITPSLTAMLGYIASATVHQPWSADDFDIVLPTLTSAGYLWPFPVGSGTRLNPNVGDLRGTVWDDRATYESLQAQVRKNMSHGVQAQVSYTWGKCLDMGSGGPVSDTFTNAINSPPYFMRQARSGQCDFNIAQTLAANYVWQLPTPKLGWATASYMLGGWQIGGIVTASTGTPFTVLIAGNPLGENSSDPWDYPNRLSGPGCASVVNPGNVSGYLKLSCFSPPVAPASFAAMCQPAAPSVAAVIPNTCMNLFGNAGRNQINGPGLIDFDFSLFKNNYIRRISETFNVQFRAEFFNIFNRANFQAPLDNETLFNQNGTPVSGAGRLDATTTDSRQIQFALKVIW